MYIIHIKLHNKNIENIRKEKFEIQNLLLNDYNQQLEFLY